MRAIVACLVFIVSGCASTPAPSAPPPLFQAPEHVSKEDSQECENRALAATQHPNQKIAEAWDENFVVQSTINAAVGLLSGIWRLPHRPSYRVANAGTKSYEHTMKSCLLAKGYTL